MAKLRVITLCNQRLQEVFFVVLMTRDLRGGGGGGRAAVGAPP